MHWKDKIIRKIFNLKCKYIINHLFSQNIMIQTYLHFLHSLSEDYSGGSFFNFNVNFTMTLMEFKEAAEKGAKELIKSIRKYDNLIEAKLNETIETMMNKFKIE